MTHPETAVRRFFQTYAQNSSAHMTAPMLSQFADPFLSADPHGTHCVHIHDFAAALSRRKQLFDQLGCQPPILVNLEETQLDARYVLAKTTWRFEFARADAKEAAHVLANSTFLLDTRSEEFKIILYLAHQDIMQVLRERGILSQ